ncbi:D-alanine transfer protein [Weissella oryzae SG25]|uniref:Protein DltD n=1 Tax=Weissella oryzae (strain DSM 25784 / JCM 18191 / LMG 30913 / SG25) TaxID=1329250 RepID=A0A069CV47_WEIOS|nr:D-alanyl-lipoteichoic acid biosynthesis protein DltD [Weissella oryzae]GAK31113.1 D-alanine transfer protein [Weissella oryzae SG25]
MKKHKILLAVGPLFVALLLVGVILFAPFNFGKLYSTRQLKEFAMNPLDKTQYNGYAIRSQVLADKQFLPIIGSSELEKISPYHPSAFSMKYKSAMKGQTPYLIGAPGTQSLPQYLYISSVAEQMKNRKVIFIISPQWFGSQGLQLGQLQSFTSNGTLYRWIGQADPKTKLTQSVAKRLQGLNIAGDNSTIRTALASLAQGKPVSDWNLAKIKVLSALWVREDYLFSWVAQMKSAQTGMYDKIDNYSKKLPGQLDYQALDKSAYKYSAQRSNNNRFHIVNDVWNMSFKHRWRNMHGYQKHHRYDASPEFADFQYVLNQFAKNHDQVEFVIPSVNNRWYKYSGLPMSSMQGFSKKIKYQLQSQGFNDIVDFTDKYNEPYFMQDTIHFGPRGWVAFDKQMVKFVNSPKEEPNYKINNDKFLSKQWQDRRVND